jgi:hypothetical protein|tara:strand:+ start:223 stop:492 length:270 start_codon:yes stop_codon:yes gene_type:complete
LKVKGKRIINTDEAAEFANSIRGQYILSQALVIAVRQLKKYEDEESVLYNMENSEPSNRSDMEYLLEAFPLYRVHEEAAWSTQENNKEV